jgi:single-strand DNA-binding protein
MAAGMIRVSLIGNLGKDPEVRHSAGGTAVCNLRVACTERAKNKAGEWEDHTEWIGVVCFGKTAENAAQFLAKGRQVYAEGRLQNREWTDKGGQKRTDMEVLADRVVFLGGKGEHAAEAEPARSAPAPAAVDPGPPPADSEMPF